MSGAYYNEIDPYAAQWLRNLISAGLIAPGIVDERSIEDVRPDELREFAQCHFFAGIGGWSYALRLAGWPDDQPVWTGSCPCQPFSAAGKGAGFEDERHLWPAWQHLIAQCRPAVVFGEQVASKDADPWIDLVQADLEGMGYAIGAVPFPAAGIGAPHIRDRLYWVAHADDARLEGWREPGRERAIECVAGSSRVARRMADANGGYSGTERQQSRGQQRQQPANGSAVGLVYAGRGPERMEGPGPANGFWRNADWLRCRDERWRPVEPESFPMGNGLSARMVRSRGYGNAIVPQQAAEFIRAYLEAVGTVNQEIAA